MRPAYHTSPGFPTAAARLMRHPSVDQDAHRPGPVSTRESLDLPGGEIDQLMLACPGEIEFERRRTDETPGVVAAFKTGNRTPPVPPPAAKLGLGPTSARYDHPAKSPSRSDCLETDWGISGWQGPFSGHRRPRSSRRTS